MNWKNRLKNYNFWISIFSAVLLILQALKIEFDFLYVNEIYTAVLGLLVVIGIINDPTRTVVKAVDAVQTKTLSTVQEEKTETINEDNNVANSDQEQSIPINDENEINNDNFKNDLQTLLTTIANDLNTKIKDMENKNLEAMNQINVKIEKFNKDEQSKFADVRQQNNPIVVEDANPYIDTIN